MLYQRVIAQAPLPRLTVELDRGPQARRLREIEALRQRILDAAETILVEEGYESLSMRRLAEAIEYAPSTIYGYFRDKKAILGAVLERTTRLLTEALARAAATPGPLTRLRMLGRAYVEFGFDYPRQYEVLFVLRGATVPVIETPAFCAAVDCFREAVSEGVRTGAFRRCVPEETAQAFWAACHGIVSLVLTQSDRFTFADHDQLLEAMLTLQIEGLRPPSLNRVAAL
jgi:AcrR family transcriptional regulator